MRNLESEKALARWAVQRYYRNHGQSRELNKLLKNARELGVVAGQSADAAERYFLDAQAKRLGYFPKARRGR